MKVLVPIKHVIDYNVRAQVKKDGTGVDLNGVKMAINPFDEIALEEALKLKEKGIVTEVVVVSIGTNKVIETLRAGLALGADRGIFIETETNLYPLLVAKILQEIVQQEAPNFIIMGKQAIDDDANQTGQMLAAFLDWPQGTFISKIDIQNNTASISREVDGGLEELDVALPAVFTTDLRLNTPRFATLPNIMKARQKPITEVSLDSLDISTDEKIRCHTYQTPSPRIGGKIVESLDDIINIIKAN